MRAAGRRPAARAGDHALVRDRRPSGRAGRPARGPHHRARLHERGRRAAAPAALRPPQSQRRGEAAVRWPDERVRCRWPAGTGSACATCWTSSALTRRPCAQDGRRGTWPPTSWPVTAGRTACPGWSSTALNGWSERVRLGEAERAVRGARHPPAVGAAVLVAARRLPKLDRLGNTHEFFVHFEDVRRAEPGWTARTSDDEAEADLWKVLGWFRRRAFKAAPVGVIPATAGRHHAARLPTASRSVTITGPPGELMLYAFGREGHALGGPRGAGRRPWPRWRRPNGPGRGRGSVRRRG